MSTDLEVRLPVIKVHGPSGDSTLTSSDSTVRRPIIDNEDECRTPTAEEHKIPTTLTCPPAPKKPKRTAACKRKLLEFDFFETDNGKEVDGFLIMSSTMAAIKRRYGC